MIIKDIKGQISSLNLQVSQIPNYQTQIEKLQKQNDELKAQNQTLNSFVCLKFRILSSMTDKIETLK
jgi:cell division protein FtsB